MKRPIAISSYLPPNYAQMLTFAAANHDTGLIDDLTDELADNYPELVRPRSDDSRFRTAKPRSERAAS